MTTYNVVYQFARDHNPAPFFAAFDRYDGVQSTLCSFIETSKTIDELTDDLSQHLGQGGRMFIHDVAERPCIHNGDAEVIVWLDQHFPLGSEENR